MSERLVVDGRALHSVHDGVLQLQVNYKRVLPACAETEGAASADGDGLVREHLAVRLDNILQAAQFHVVTGLDAGLADGGVDIGGGVC